MLNVRHLNSSLTTIVKKNNKLALIVAQCLSIHLSIWVSVRDSLSHAYVRSIARREPRRLPACRSINYLIRLV